MQLQIQGRNLRVSRQLKTYIEKKIGKLEHYLPTLKQARVELKVEKTRDEAQREVVQVTLFNNGHILRGEERAPEFETAVDIVLEKLYKQIDRYKEKHYHRRAHSSETPALATPAETGRIVRRKRITTPPLTEEEAIDQMEWLGHTFFLFAHPDNGAVNLLYRRADGNYGLIEPVVETRK